MRYELAALVVLASGLVAHAQQQTLLTAESTPDSLPVETVGLSSDSGCDHKCCSKDSCRAVCCQHCAGIFAEYLFLQASNADVAYGNVQNGITGPGIVPMGVVGVASPDYNSGFRVGINKLLDECSSLGITYTWFESTRDSQVEATGANVINPLVTFPGTVNAGFTAQTATATYAVDFQLADVEHRVLWKSADGYGLNFVLGARYGHLDQDLLAVFPFAPPDGQTSVTTNIEFDGGGLRFGLEGERRWHYHSPFKLYAKGFANILAGRYRTNYVQVNQFNGTEANLFWQDDRIVTILEGELGTSWTSYSGHITISAGYYVAGWFNSITTPSFIQAVQTTNFVGVDQTLAFDGLTSRIEWRF